MHEPTEKDPKMIHWLFSLALELDTPPTPPAYEGDPNLVTPGVVGFIITFAIAIITVLLVLDMVRRIRRVRYRAAVQNEIAAEIDAAKPPTDTSTDPGAGSDKAGT
jgi:hypothetical protein